MALARKSRTAMDMLKSNIDYISTYSKKFDDMLGRKTCFSNEIRLNFYRWGYTYGCDHGIMWKSWKWKIELMVCLINYRFNYIKY
jgi:hypothetical protein